MTPDEVVERARELEGQEVLLTVRGVVRCGALTTWAESLDGKELPGLRRFEDIRPAPMRIEPGGFYLDADERVLIGRTDGRLFALGNTDGRLFALGNMGSVYDPDMVDGLRAAKVVPA